MKQPRPLTIALLLVLGLAVLLLMALDFYFTVEAPRRDAHEMQAAVQQAREWFTLIARAKAERGIPLCRDSTIPFRALLGEAFSPITTSLGSLQAKEISANPEFAALVVRLLNDAKMRPGETVGLAISGSFPALTISVLAALQTLALEPVIFSSVGASNYGANQARFTWPDIERALQSGGGMPFASTLVTPGGDDDRSGGLLDSSLAVVAAACRRNDMPLFVPGTLQESIEKKMEILQSRHIRLFINIGGNQTSLGGCVHGAAIRNGYHETITVCRDQDRGLLMRCNEKGIPILHLLNMRDLAAQYGLDLAPGRRFQNSISLYQQQSVHKIPVSLAIVTIALALAVIKKRGLQA